MNPHVNAIASRLSLRTPQREALEILDRVCDTIELTKDADPATALKAIQSEYPTVTDFERDFPSLCFALATGVGKTRLMGAFISYLFRTGRSRHFFVLAPNLTIYNKLIADFTPNTPKYVFQGISEFTTNLPEIITGDNYESGRGVRIEKAAGTADYTGQLVMFDDSPIHVNIFNISKINSEVRGGKSPRIKRLSEYIGESYFEYLSKLDDLVLLMDESHRYRASAGVRAINELRPILGLELTATPQTERGQAPVPFNNVIYSYPLSKALDDGYVKEPAVATRENFSAADYTVEGLEKLKLEDGVRIHEETKVQLDVYARENDRKRVKPFMLVIAKDTEHATALQKVIEDKSFFSGQYSGRVITVHSALSGEEKDENVQQLLTVEDPENPTEIVIHVNMLKEGWDVTNLYTIVPLRTANSRTLVEQSIGRGLRLPYGKRTGVSAVDRLTIVCHDKFQEIIDEANRGDSILVKGIYIGKDIPEKKSQVVVAQPQITQRITGVSSPDGQSQKALFDKPEERQVAQVTLDVIKDYERLSRSADLISLAVQQEITKKVTEALRPVQAELAGMGPEVNVAQVVAKVTEAYTEMTIDIPRIVVVPKGEVTCGFADFDLDTSTVHYQPIAQDILIQHLHDQERYKLRSGNAVVEEVRLEDHLVRGLIDFNDISYDAHAEFLYKLTGQMVRHLQFYLPDEEAVLNVLQYYQQSLVDLIHVQMLAHYQENATSYDVTVTKGFTTLRETSFTTPADEKTRNFRTPVDERQMIRGMVFGGFSKCLYSLQKFQSDPERRFSVVLEDDHDVLKWFRPAKGQFRIYYTADDEYIPDFAVEGKTANFVCEPKRRNEMDDAEVLAKARAAAKWCKCATEHGGGKPWTYLLIPHDDIDASKTLAGLTAKYTFRATEVH